MTRSTPRRPAALALGGALACALACAFAAPAHAATFTAEPHWKAGDHADYVLTKSKSRVMGGVAQPIGTATTDVHIDVAEAGANGFVMVWTYGDTRFDGAASGATDLAAKMAGLMKGLQLRLRLDARGHIAEVLNWQAVRDQSAKATASMKDTLVAAGMPASAAAQSMAQIQGMFSTEPAVRASSAQEAALLTSIFGQPLDTAKPLALRTNLPSPLGGDAVPATVRFTLVDAGGAGKPARIDLRQDPDPAALERAIGQAITHMAAATGRPVPTGDAMPQITVHDEAHFKIDPPSGWAQSISYTRTTGATTNGTTQQSIETTTLAKR